MTIWMRKILSMLLAFTLTFSWTLPALAKELSQETQVQTEATETVAEEEEVQEETIATEPEGEESSEETTAPAPEGEETVPEEPTEQETLPPEETEEPEAEEPEAPQREMPQFFQGDYPDARYGNGTIASDGDSVVSLAMVATYLTGGAAGICLEPAAAALAKGRKLARCPGRNAAGLCGHCPYGPEFGIYQFSALCGSDWPYGG